MHKQKLAILIASIVGILGIFMPWVTIPIRGSSNLLSLGDALLKAKDAEILGAVGTFFAVSYFIFFAVFLVAVFRGDRTKPIEPKHSKARNPKLGVVVAIVAIISCTFPCIFIKGLMDEVSAIRYSMGIGTYITTFALLCVLLLANKGIAIKLFGNDGFDTETSNIGEKK